jgi:hypothetical protein
MIIMIIMMIIAHHALACDEQRSDNASLRTASSIGKSDPLGRTIISSTVQTDLTTRFDNRPGERRNRCQLHDVGNAARQAQSTASSDIRTAPDPPWSHKYLT